MGSFWPKYVMLELKKYREVMFDGTGVINITMWPPFLHPPKKDFPFSLGKKRIYYLDTQTKGGLLICFENCQSVPYSHRQIRSRMMKKFIIVNDTHMEELVLYWKKSLKYKVGCFWRFSYVYTINCSFNSIIVQMPEKHDSSSRQ